LGSRKKPPERGGTTKGGYSGKTEKVEETDKNGAQMGEPSENPQGKRAPKSPERKRRDR